MPINVVRRIFQPDRLHLQVQRRCCPLGGVELISRLAVEQDGQSGSVGKRLGEKLDLLLRQLQLLKHQSGDVAARTGQARNITACQRIEIDGDHDHRNEAARARYRLQCDLGVDGDD